MAVTPDPAAGSLYAVLGVAPDASDDEVRRAYLRLARRFHPDVVASADEATRNTAEQTMRQVNAAWAVLGDPGRRAAYDRTGATGPAGSEAGEAPDPGFRPFDPADDPFDPLAVPDEPYRHDPKAQTAARRLSTLAPVALFAASVVCAVLGLVLALSPLLVLAMILFALSCVAFVAVPLMALARATRDEG